VIKRYWKFGDNNYTNKFQAIQSAGKKINEITFHVFEDSFLSFDFSKEPNRTLKELIDERCFQLRDKYSYIKFWFSGGSDSTTVLNAFIRNNIHIDEICVYIQSFTDNFDTLANYELIHFTVPYLKNLSKTLLEKTKISTYYFGFEDYKKILNDKWFESKNELCPRAVFTPHIRGNNFCNLYADLSPSLVKKDNKFFDEIYDTDNLTGYRMRNTELFFKTSDLPELHSKQCHIIKNHLKKTNDNRDMKQIVREIVRDKAVASDHHLLVKKDNQDINKDLNFITAKGKSMLKDKSAKTIIDRYRFLLGHRVSGMSLIRIYQGYKACELDLGE
jgi:hypothetical protein